MYQEAKFGIWKAALVTHYVLFVISLADGVMNIAGITTRPDESWILQIGRNATEAQSEPLHAKRYLIIVVRVAVEY